MQVPWYDPDWIREWIKEQQALIDQPTGCPPEAVLTNDSLTNGG